jgi:NAD-dependent deacetylase
MIVSSEIGKPGGVGDVDIDTSRVRAMVEQARRIVVLTGAGISTDSGIPDFRGPNGVWTKNPEAEKAATIQHYMRDPNVRMQAWQTRIASPAWSAQPNPGHRAITDIERAGKLLAVVTQNVDELHQRAGTSAELVVEVHGTMFRTACWECGDERPMEEALDRVRAGDPDPACELCGGILKSATISFGQALGPEVIDRALQVAEEADLLLAVGSTLQVYPAANVVPRARFAGAQVVIVNAEPTNLDDLADVVLRGSISEILPAITSGIR